MVPLYVAVRLVFVSQLTEAASQQYGQQERKQQTRSTPALQSWLSFAQRPNNASLDTRL